MRYYDCHIHLSPGKTDMLTPAEGYAAMTAAGVTRGNVFSPAPGKFWLPQHGTPDDCVGRIETLLTNTAVSAELMPFFWVDPTEPDAIEQVRYAAQKGCVGFKIICSGHYPGDERAMPVYREIVKLKRPIMFHSGILYDGLDSSKYNRPAEFECLLNVPGLRFSVAHFSWPWVDECIALYGKFQSARSRYAPSEQVDLWLDNTPGTPAMYREYAFRHVLGFEIDTTNRVMFGVDTEFNHYNTAYAQEIIDHDNVICNAMGVDDETRQKIFYDNAVKFVRVE